MAKRKMVAVGAGTNLAVTMVQEPRKLSEVMAGLWTGRIGRADTKLAATKERLFEEIDKGFTKDGWVIPYVEDFHEASAVARVWREAESIREKRGLETVLLWAATERDSMIDGQRWNGTSTSLWHNVANATDVNATLRALGGRHDSVIENVRHILDGLKDGSIVDDTE